MASAGRCVPAFVLGMLVAPGLALAQADAPATEAPVTDAPATEAPVTDAPLILATPIVTLDKDRLFQDSAFGKEMQARFEAASNDLVAENRRLEAALEQEERSLTERRKTTDPETFRTLAAEFDTRVEELRKAQDAKSRALTRSREADQQRFFEAAVPVLGQLMVDLSAVAIIDRSAIILSFDQLDITDQAIARLDATLAADPGAADPGASDPAGADPAAAPTEAPSPQP